MTTLCRCSIACRSSLAKLGRCVWNLVELVPLESFTGLLTVPVMASPVLVMLTTLPVSTWSRNVLYEIVTVGGWPAEKARLLMTMLATRRMASITQKRSVRMGASRSGRFSGGFGAVLGAGAWGGAGAIKRS